MIPYLINFQASNLLPDLRINPPNPFTTFIGVLAACFILSNLVATTLGSTFVLVVPLVFLPPDVAPLVFLPPDVAPLVFLPPDAAPLPAAADADFASFHKIFVSLLVEFIIVST